MKEQILKVRSEGLSYSQIKDRLNCSKATISYHCGDGQKYKNKIRTAKNRINKKQKEYPYKKLRKGVYFFQGGNNGVPKFTHHDVLSKFGNNTICYLTGKPINLLTDKYHLDHIIPKSSGGSNSIDNLGILSPEANAAKGKLQINELIELCRQILNHIEQKNI
jgi:5-methylcytosine-specific restriction endonuclease McrA